jgi:RNA polymerase sigma factor (sigma-70 family)
LPDDTPQLTRDIASGNPEAFAQLYRARFDEMYRWARRATGRDEAFCLDVVQDAMMRIIRSLKPLQSERQLRGYLRAATQSCALDRLRSERRRRERERRAARSETHDGDPSALDERLDWLRGELEALDPEIAQMLTMRHRFGWTLRRIGNAVGLSPGAVDGRLGRTREALRKQASEQFNDQ